MKSDYEKYFLYKIKYLNLRNKMKGGETNIPPINTTTSSTNIQEDNKKENLMIYNKKVSYLPNEYLQNIIFIIITNNNLKINDFYINYFPEPVEHNKSSSKYNNIHIFLINKNINNEQIKKIVDDIDEKLKAHLVN